MNNNFQVESDKLNYKIREKLVTSLWRVIIDNSKRALELQSSDGSMPSGCNGPYKDNSTPVRNTAHWLQLFIALDERERETAYREAAHKCADYLCDEKVRPTKRLFQNRQRGGKDKWNGLIGQVWPLEGLLVASKYLERGDCLNVLFETLKYIPYDEQLGLWRIAPTESKSRLPLTFNQQVWMASLIARMLNLKSKEYRIFIGDFLDKISSYMHSNKEGIIIQAITSINRKDSLKNKFPILDFRNIRISHHLKALFRYLLWRNDVYLGYHAFTLYGLSIIKQIVPNHQFWNNKMISKALVACNDEEFLTLNSTNPFGNSYHLVGIEAAFSLLVFQYKESLDHFSLIQRLVCHDLETTFNRKSLKARYHVTDVATVTARMYESIRLIRILEG